MNSKTLMVLATVSEDGKPESAVVGFGQTKKLEIICGTSKLSRKAENILKHKYVSIVIGWDDQGTLQYEGTARVLKVSEATKYSAVYFDKNPIAKQFKDNPDEIYILITPDWLRFTELTSTPWNVTELKF